MTACNVSFACYAVANLDVAYTGTDFCYYAYVFVTDGHGCLDGLLTPFVPFVDVQVGTADCGLLYLDKHIVNAYFGHGDLFHPYTLLWFFLN
jgi:hypothetical protein